VDTPLFVLAFDHRASFMRSFLGIESDPSPADVERARTAKDVIAEGLLEAVRTGAVPRGSAAALVDATYGDRAIAMLRDADLPVAVPVERSGRRELAFEDGWGERLTAIDPAWAKVLVRFNPSGDAAMNDRQIGRLRELQEVCTDAGRALMLELLVPPEPAQDQPGYDAEVRPALVVEAIERLRAAGIAPSLWKLEGFEERARCEAVAAVADTPCVILGRGQDDVAVDRWLRVAAGVEGFVGFAIGRSIWWDALMRFFEAHETEEARAPAVALIARAYARYGEVYADAALDR